MKKLNISYEKRKSLYGYGFLALWFIGALFFFIIPVIESFYYCFNDVKPDESQLVIKWVGLDNFKYIFNTDPNFRTRLTDSLVATLWQTPMILIFSLFIAIIINQKFKGRTFVRAIFFLPVIIATGPVYNIITGNLSTNGNENAQQFTTMFETDLVAQLMEFIGLYGISPQLETLVSTATSDVLNLVWSSGIQILLFLGALQTVSVSAKEAAQMEGATAWEFFWKITLPQISPIILANIIYTVIDTFTMPSNEVMTSVISVQNSWLYGRAAAMVWTYFAIILVAVGIIVSIVNRFVYYEVD